MSPTTSDDRLGPVTPLAMTGTLRLRTITVITVANMPSVRASSLPLPRPGMLDWSKLISTTRERSLSSGTFKRFLRDVVRFEEKGMAVGREKFGPQAVKDAGPANAETASLSFSLTVDDLAVT